MVSKENKKLAGILCSVVILLSCIVGVEVFVSSDATVKADGFTSIDLRVTPSNSLFKLGVNESVTFTAQALNGTGPFSYSWVVTGSSSFSLLINDVLVDVKEGLSLDFVGESLTICYPKATEEFISVTCHVTDKNGFVGCLLQPFIVADPYTSPGYYFDAASSTATYIVQTDGLGWYRIIRGYTGAVTTYSNPNDALTAAFSGCSGAGSVYVCAGDYNGASATILTGTQLVLEKGVSSLTYSCDTGATCMIIDYASGLLRYYDSGALTAEVNWASGTTNLAPNWQGTWNTTVLSIIQSNTLTSLSLSGNVTANNFESTHPMGAYSYMIYQDPDFATNGLYHAKAANGTICFTSTNATTIINNAISETNSKSVLVKNGNYTVNRIQIHGKEGFKFIAESRATWLIATGDSVIIEIGHLVDTTKQSKHIEVSGFSLDGTAQADPTAEPMSELNVGGGINIFGVNGGVYSDDVLVQNNYIYNVGNDGICSSYAGNWTAFKNVIVNCRPYYAAIHPHSGSHSAYILYNEIYNSTRGGIRHGNYIIGNIIRDCGNVGDGAFSAFNTYPSIMGTDFNGVEYLGGIIKDNIINNSLTTAIFSWSGDTIIENNKIYTVKNGVGILVHQNQNSTVIGGEIRGNIIRTVNTGSYTHGIMLYSVTDCIVTGNYIYYPASNGIEIGLSSGASCNRNLISNNHIYYATIGVNIAKGSFCAISNNYIYRGVDGIRIETGTYNKLDGNFVMNNSRYAINIALASALNNRIINNQLMYFTTASINGTDISETNIIKNNIIADDFCTNSTTPD